MKNRATAIESVVRHQTFRDRNPIFPITLWLNLPVAACFVA